jgi:hypothetical protein
MPPSGFRTLAALDSPYPERDGKQFRVSAGMLVSAEVNLGSRTVMEYLLSPVQKVTHEAGRKMRGFGGSSPQAEKMTFMHTAGPDSEHDCRCALVSLD